MKNIAITFTIIFALVAIALLIPIIALDCVTFGAMMFVLFTATWVGMIGAVATDTN